MNVQITFRNMESSKILEEYAQEQLQKVYDFLEHEREPIFVELVFQAAKARAHHHAELRIKTPDYYLVTDYEAQEMYDVLDRVVDTMYRKMTEKRKELQDKGKTIDKF